ncbi:sulfate adenylyltransferase subunit CysD [Arthrobacter sp. MYb224]|uniref:sulfate adenylyltransferase subunit CysD n=1 Tax=Arthrobacter sp. MYb224 TaxID=1848600 RepID=UPI000CFAF2DD|nr:sulfate adenylyltransferase subunit CysD [Arthrobacter sp. MYb224]PQZ97035.1 sulfate adenylyltransferase subunit CysD [Arthrobacter sp. MYb224]
MKTKTTAGLKYQLDQLTALEAESIFIIREVVAELERPGLLFSGGKDSAVLLHLAAKAFAPAAIPFPVVHIDTGHNFQEVLDFRDAEVARRGVRLIIGSVQKAIDAGDLVEERGGSRNRIQTPVLLDTIEKNDLNALMGGARRDEEKARAKERVFSFRDEFGQWDPRNQRPELWSLYNSKLNFGESLRVFPLSNWTELDIWNYVLRENVLLPSIYYAHEREVFERNQMIFGVHTFCQPKEHEQVRTQLVRYRTVGDASLTAAVASSATTAAQIVEEVATSRITERGATRGDDQVSEAAMEDRKKEGYF